MKHAASPVTPELIEAIRAQYRLEWSGVHGIGHWERVRAVGLALAAKTGADPRIVELFAFLHDACRYNDKRDPEHGPRAVLLARALRGQCYELRDGKFGLLCEALQSHTLGLQDPRPDVATCWDADRLDLGRVGITPRRELLCTAAAREDAFFNWATQRPADPAA